MNNQISTSINNRIQPNNLMDSIKLEGCKRRKDKSFNSKKNNNYNIERINFPK